MQIEALRRYFQVMRKRIGVTVVFAVFASAMGAQDAAQPPPIQNGFASIRLGLEFGEVEERLAQSAAFRYRGEPDVSLVPLSDRRVIEAEGATFIERGFFQFSEDRLYIIILRLNRSELDHYTMYTQLSDKYGQPDSLSPQEIVWEDEAVRLSLERPLTVKYVAKAVFEDLMAESQVEQSARTLSRDQFVEQF